MRNNVCCNWNLVVTIFFCLTINYFTNIHIFANVAPNARIKFKNNTFYKFNRAANT